MPSTVYWSDVGCEETLTSFTVREGETVFLSEPDLKLNPAS